MQDNQDKETSTDEVQTEYKRIKIILLGGEFFRTRPDRSLGPPSLLCNLYRVCFPRVKRPGCGANQPPHLAEVKERAELYPYSPVGLHSLF